MTEQTYEREYTFGFNTAHIKGGVMNGVRYETSRCTNSLDNGKWWTFYLFADTTDDYELMLSLDTWHHGVTYKNDETRKVGCDYNHLWDQNEYYSEQDILRDVAKVIAEFNAKKSNAL